MKPSKLILLVLFLMGTLFSEVASASWISDYCASEQSAYDNAKSAKDAAYLDYSSSSYGSKMYYENYNRYSDAFNYWLKTSNDLTACYGRKDVAIQALSQIFQKWYDAYWKRDYESAIQYFSEYLRQNADPSDADYVSAKGNLVLSYIGAWNVLLLKDDYDGALSKYQSAYSVDPKNVTALKMIGAIYIDKKDFKSAKSYLQLAYWAATSSDDIESIKKLMENADSGASLQERIASAPSNDPLSGFQYYLKDLKVPDAWRKVEGDTKQVVVAVIDDGISINHPDLTDSIWTDKLAKYGSSKVIDFTGDKLVANLPTGEHWTMVAGIIGAKINNSEGIAGIAKNVKIMPLRVFPLDGNAKEESILKALEYAIDHGADIINLSLGSSQFAYSEKYDELIKRAYTKKIVVVIAAWNGDVLSSSTNWVNLTNNPISPVCNNGGKYNKYSIGVYSSDENWYRTNWTNYGDCAPFMAPGVNIVSTSIPAFNSNYGTNYNMLDGTSFSAPMVSGIVALGYNKYGKVPPQDVYWALKASMEKNSVGNYVINASKYLDNLDLFYGAKIKKEKEAKIRAKATVSFNAIRKEISRLLKSDRKNKLLIYRKDYSDKSIRLMGDDGYLAGYMVTLIDKELKKYP